MAILEHEILINTPIEKLWEVLINLKEVEFYNSHVKSVKCSFQKRGIGSSRECQLSQGVAKERITAIDELKSFSMEMYESDFPLEYMKWTYFFSEKNGVTTLKTVSQYKVKCGLIGVILNKLVFKNKLDKTLKEVFKNLKSFVEAKK